MNNPQKCQSVDHGGNQNITDESAFYKANVTIRQEK